MARYEIKPNSGESYIEDFKGFVVFFSKYGAKEFHGISINEEGLELTAPTLEALENKIKKQKNEQHKFKPLAVIQIRGDLEGKITSKVADNQDYIVFSHLPEYGGDKNIHNHEQLASYHGISSYKHEGFRDGYEPNFAKATEANLKVLQEIKDIDTNIVGLQKEQERLRTTYTDYVTENSLESKMTKQIVQDISNQSGKEQ